MTETLPKTDSQGVELCRNTKDLPSDARRCGTTPEGFSLYHTGETTVYGYVGHDDREFRNACTRQQKRKHPKSTKQGFSFSMNLLSFGGE